MRKRGIAAVICLMVLLALFPWLWFCSQGDDQPVEAVFYEGGERLDASVRMCHGDDPVFAASLDDFIRCFNGHFEQETGRPYFPEANRWQEPRLHQEALDTMENRLIGWMCWILKRMLRST